MAEAVNINDLLDGHVGLDLECLDRIYLNAYVPNLQVGGQVVRFLTEHDSAGEFRLLVGLGSAGRVGRSSSRSLRPQ